MWNARVDVVALLESLPGCNFLRSPGPSGGSKSTPRRPRGRSKSTPGGSLGALGGRLAALEGSLALLLGSWRAPGAGLEASWAQMAPIWGASWGHFSGSFLRPLLNHVCCCLGSIWGTIWGSLFERLRSTRQDFSPEGATCKNIEKPSGCSYFLKVEGC